MFKYKLIVAIIGCFSGKHSLGALYTTLQTVAFVLFSLTVPYPSVHRDPYRPPLTRYYFGAQLWLFSPCKICVNHPLVFWVSDHRSAVGWSLMASRLYLNPAVTQQIPAALLCLMHSNQFNTHHHSTIISVSLMICLFVPLYNNVRWYTAIYCDSTNFSKNITHILLLFFVCHSWWRVGKLWMNPAVSSI